MKISYAIPVCNEHEELKRLLEFLVQNIEEKVDEIVVQCDQGNTTPEVYKVLVETKFQCDKGNTTPEVLKVLVKDIPTIKVIEFPLKGDFASFKNNLKENCSGDWIFQIDADELPHESLTTNLKELLKLTPIQLTYF